jgi:hypothetical protein
MLVLQLLGILSIKMIVVLVLLLRTVLRYLRSIPSNITLRKNRMPPSSICELWVPCGQRDKP